MIYLSKVKTSKTYIVIIKIPSEYYNTFPPSDVGSLLSSGSLLNLYTRKPNKRTSS